MLNFSDGCMFITVGGQNCNVSLPRARDFVLAEYPQGCLRAVPVASQAEVRSMLRCLG